LKHNCKVLIATVTNVQSAKDEKEARTESVGVEECQKVTRAEKYADGK